MIRTTEVYSLQGHVGSVIVYDGTAYYISATNELFPLPNEVFQSLQQSRALMRGGAIFEKSAQEILKMQTYPVEKSSIFQAITRPDIDSQVLCVGNDIYYLKDTFLTDMPSGQYQFSDGEKAIEISLMRQEVRSYQSCKVFEPKVSDLIYLYRFENNEYKRMELKQNAD